jgi:mRNA guanylyltransferase
MERPQAQFPDPNDPHFDPVNNLVVRAGGIWAGHDLQEQFKEEVANLLQRTSRGFPGAQPVSFAAKHFVDLKKDDYYVCEKTDGIRYLLWMTHERDRNLTYLIDRKNDYYFLQGLFFPHHEDKTLVTRFHDDTILDGELVEDRIPGQKSVMKFLVFDCLVLDGNVLMHRPFDKRLGYLKQQVLKPWKTAYDRERANNQDFNPPPFILEDKNNEFSYGLEKMFKEIIPKVKQIHGNDGLIFTCKDTPYHPGTDEKILKWKPPEDNTVDFLLHIEWSVYSPDPNDPSDHEQPDYDAYPNDFGLYIFHGDRAGEAAYARVGSLYVSPGQWDELKAMDRPLQDTIVECYQEVVPHSNGTNGHHDPNNTIEGGRRWRFHRIRDDKLEANHVSTYTSVIDSINDHVTEDDLLREADDIRSCWKEREKRKPPPPQSSQSQGPRR